MSPTATHMRVLRLLGAGATIPVSYTETPSYRVVVNKVPVQRILIRTMHEMVRHGWVACNAERERYELTPAGRDRVDVTAYVRGFAAAHGGD